MNLTPKTPLTADDEKRIYAGLAISEGLNPGIRSTVLFLRWQGFDTLDSGDGRTKQFECDLKYPYVHMEVDPAKLVSEANRLRKVLEAEGVVFDAPSSEPEATPNIQATYSPIDGSAFLSLFNVTLK